MDHALDLTEWARNDSDPERSTMMRLAAGELRSLRAERDRAQRACEQMGERIAELEAALRDLLYYADIGLVVTGVVYPCGTHRDVIARAHDLLRADSKTKGD